MSRRCGGSGGCQQPGLVTGVWSVSPRSRASASSCRRGAPGSSGARGGFPLPPHFTHCGHTSTHTSTHPGAHVHACSHTHAHAHAFHPSIRTSPCTGHPQVKPPARSAGWAAGQEAAASGCSSSGAPRRAGSTTPPRHPQRGSPPSAQRAPSEASASSVLQPGPKRRPFPPCLPGAATPRGVSLPTPPAVQDSLQPCPGQHQVTRWGRLHGGKHQSHRTPSAVTGTAPCPGCAACHRLVLF